MTFEEFFQKKKIDLKALGAERADLLKEFKQHFELMGEKSFDHTKKYWFNKLRRSYPLKESPKPVEKSPETATAANSSPGDEKPGGTAASKTATPGGRPAVPKPGFKPRFKAGKTTSPAAKPAPSNTDSAAPSNAGSDTPAKKPAYKPRFRPGMTKVQKKEKGEE